MIIIIRKIQVVLACVTAFLFIMSVGMYNSANNNTKASGEIIVIDAGHGGMDGGAVGVTGVTEKGINLIIAQNLKKLAEADGKKVIMTREEDISLHNTDSAKIRDQKRSDLEARRTVLQQNPDAVFVSIHLNKFEQQSVKGAQVFYANNDESRILAERIQSSLAEGLADGNKRVAKPAPSNLYIFKGCSSTAVVVECGFLSNPDEEKLLADKSYQQKVAECIYNGIKKSYQ